MDCSLGVCSYGVRARPWTNIAPLHYVQSSPEGEDIYRIKSRRFSGVIFNSRACPPPRNSLPRDKSSSRFQAAGLLFYVPHKLKSEPKKPNSFYLVPARSEFDV